MAQLSHMLDETEIKTDKYLEKIRKNEQEVIKQKTKEERETEDRTATKKTKLKHVKELLIKRDQEGMIFYTSVDTTKILTA